jgi:hypothetical protein
MSIRQPTSLVGVRRCLLFDTPAKIAARSSSAMSIFFIWSMACIALGCLMNASALGGMLVADCSFQLWHRNLWLRLSGADERPTDGASPSFDRGDGLYFGFR